VTRQRLRPAYTDDQLAQIYAAPHDHLNWPDHRLRVNVTTEVARWAADGGVGAAADLSCGNGTILKATPARERHFGDYAPGHQYTGPIEKTITDLPEVDLFICSETLEHLDDPDTVLSAIREKTGILVLSTPVDAWDDDNPEHYWAWSRDAVESMLDLAGFTPLVYTAIDFRPMGWPYSFGVWAVR
jgi:hypothetical protein